MEKRTFIYGRLDPSVTGTSGESFSDLRRDVEARGDVFVGCFCDDTRIEGKGKNAAWRRLLADLSQIDQIVLADAGDLPGRTVKDLLGILAALTDQSVSVLVPGPGIDTSTGPAAILALVAAYRRAKLSKAIKRGQDRARATGKRIGRPSIPAGVRRRILAALAEGGGVRPTGRKFNVSPASVVAIKRSMQVSFHQLAG
jgi:DNA invertase Pin-like site-specific DNA recombinase